MFTPLATMPGTPLEISDLDPRDQVVLFPSLGHLGADGLWHVQVHGDVFSPAPKLSLGKRFLLRMLQKSMRASDEAFASEIFQQRIARFLAINGHDKRIAIRIGDVEHPLAGRSRRNGHFHATLTISPAALARAGLGPAGQPLALNICGRAADASPAGQVYLVPPQGLSIISDIDDTLKHTHVGCRRSLLANTFLREFETIEGMAPLYRDWAARGAAFHYVSSSPWQLYGNLAEHLQAEGFPAGSFHLRWFRLRDHLLRRILLLRRSGKITVIQAILKLFPQRRFVLIGDSGEKDPEIYGALARKYRGQVAKILIREMPGPRANAARFAKAFRKLPPSVYMLYREPSEIAASIDELLPR
jgi:phosphatidate phosphatase APP1